VVTADSTFIGASPPRATVVTTGTAQEGFARLPGQIARLATEIKGGRVCEIGAGPNPMLSADDLARLDVEYVCLDVSEDELEKASGAYHKVCADVVRGGAELPGDFDLVLSRHVAEHIDDPRAFHRNVRAMLRPGGCALHWFSTLYEPVFLVNRLLPERVAERLLLTFEPQRASTGRQGKFPPYYRWCRGPTRRHLRRLERLGYEIREYDAYFGHTYFRRVRPLQALVDRVAGALARRRVYALSSYALVVLRRSGDTRIV
jgi:2-polyprenyl-3-methyl-5-hydroxy-6-metoxy-1,4-benzoquinol methylase